MSTDNSKNYERGTEGGYRGESVAGVGNKHAGFADCAVANRHALYEPGGAHFHHQISSPPPPPPTTTKTTTTTSSTTMPLPLCSLI